MNPREALDYLHRVTVGELVESEEQAQILASVAINTLRIHLDALEHLVERILESCIGVVGGTPQ